MRRGISWVPVNNWTAWLRKQMSDTLKIPIVSLGLISKVRPVPGRPPTAEFGIRPGRAGGGAEPRVGRRGINSVIRFPNAHRENQDLSRRTGRPAPPGHQPRAASRARFCFPEPRGARRRPARRTHRRRLFPAGAGEELTDSPTPTVLPHSPSRTFCVRGDREPEKTPAGAGGNTDGRARRPRRSPRVSAPRRVRDTWPGRGRSRNHAPLLLLGSRAQRAGPPSSAPATT